jgi:hypothetical protein
LTDNLPVKIAAGHSPFAAKDNEQRLVVLAGQALAFRVAVNPVDLAVDLLWWNDLTAARGTHAEYEQATNQTELHEFLQLAADDADRTDLRGSELSDPRKSVRSASSAAWF